MRLSDFDVLTFDCYGTLIDWESGLAAAIGPWLRRHGVKAPFDRVLELFALCQSAQEDETPAMLYSEVLAHTLRRMAKAWDVEATDDEAVAFGASVGDWPAFADSPGALAYLKRHYKLVVLSNVDHASFAGSNRRLGVEFDAVYTAEDVGSYKPDLRNFRYLLDRLENMGVAKERILHVAQSRYHDHAPAQKIGLRSAWIDRRHGKPGGGATKPVNLARDPDFYFPSLAALAEAHRKEMAAG
jgi:2-haloalkanoic acid dehalogenase type II